MEISCASNNLDASNDRLPQVCDRCRIKKIKCNGERPSCQHCRVAGVNCTATVKLRRRTKPRRYDANKDRESRMVSSLEAENKALREELQSRASETSTISEPEAITGISPRVDGLDHTRRALAHTPVPGTSFNMMDHHGSTWNQASHPVAKPHMVSHNHIHHDRRIAKESTTTRTADPVVTHLGRLVSTSTGVDRFAGSTTGVHFIHTVEQKYQQILNTTAVRLPEDAFRLHTLIQPLGLFMALQDTTTHTFDNMSPLLALSAMGTVEYYLDKFDRFFRRWGSVWPVLTSKQFLAGFDDVYRASQAGLPMAEEDYGILGCVYIVLAIDGWDNASASISATTCFDFAQRLQPKTSLRGDLCSLQMLLLTTLYLQLSGQHALLVQTSGMAVRLAQSLGCHRHHRRFKFCVGELESRNRLWWCTYIIDLLSSVSHGLPRMVNDEDVDTDLPMDTDFDDMTLKDLPLPLPGEATRFSIFLQYIKLCRIMGKTVKQLYTTTHRRGGVDKIRLLDRELRVWQHVFETSFELDLSTPLEVGNDRGNIEPLSDDTTFAIPYIQILGNFAMLLVHQPALTFSTNVVQFASSLEVCTRSCKSLMSLYDEHQDERRLLYLQPCSTRLIFQSALMGVFCHWHNITMTKDGGAVQQQHSEDSTINVALRLLSRQTEESLRSGMQEQSATGAIENIMSTLRSLEQFDQPESIVSSGLMPAAASDMPQSNSPSWNDGSELPWHPSALDSLNQLDMLEWSADAAAFGADGALLGFPEHSAISDANWQVG